MLSLLLIGTALASGLEERAYQRAVDLVEGLYLYPEDLDASALLRASAEELSDELHWLKVENQGSAINLQHGDGTLIGSVSVATLDTLPGALASLEELVEGAGYPVDDTDVRLASLQGMTRALDRYSRVLSGDGLDRFDVRLKGTLVGVGLGMRIQDDQLVIARVNEGGPAEKGGLKVGDRLVRIDGRSTVNMPTREANRRIRGEDGTTVVLAVERDGRSLDLTLERAQIVVPNVESKVLEDGVAYLRISHMSQRTVENLLTELDRLGPALDNGLVLDLRHNTGGSMKESARTVDQFVDEGLLLRTAGPDGGQVRNLQARMDAEPGGRLLEVPVAVLVDERTASGAEILAGSLLELDRAVLIGRRTYGKGTVQKIYPLGDDARLKLTVARYILENDRHITEEGLHPDVPVGSIALDSYGVHYEGWTADRDTIVPWVQESWDWRDEEVPSIDLPEELARRAVLAAKSPERAVLLEAVRREGLKLADEQREHLRAAFAVQGIDWSPVVEPVGKAPPIDVQIQVVPDPDSPDVLVVTGELTNRSPDIPLHQASIELSSVFSGWDGLALPVGRLEPGATLTGSVRVPLRPGIRQRQDEVDIAVRADGYGRLPAGTTVLTASSAPKPPITAEVRLVGEGRTRKAVVKVANPTEEALEGVEVHFAYPGDIDVELVDQAARVPRLDAKATHTFELDVLVGPSVEGDLPLRLEIEAPSHGRLARWPLELPLDGGPVQLQPPRIDAVAHPVQFPTMELAFPLVIRDDRKLAHVVVHQNGRKVAWAGPAEQQVVLTAHVEIEPGLNRFFVEAEDDQGLRTRERFVIRGVPTDGVVTP